MAVKKSIAIIGEGETEFWFLLHFLPQFSTKHYETYEDVLPDLQHYMPGYEKTSRYFKKNNLYKYLTENGDLGRAIGYAEELTRLSEVSPEDKIAYSQMHLVFDLIASMDEGDADKNEQKTENQNRKDENRRQMGCFIADLVISDLKMLFYPHKITKGFYFSLECIFVFFEVRIML
jgi:hypothetical protein